MTEQTYTCRTCETFYRGTRARLLSRCPICRADRDDPPARIACLPDGTWCDAADLITFDAFGAARDTDRPTPEDSSRAELLNEFLTTPSDLSRVEAAAELAAREHAQAIADDLAALAAHDDRDPLHD